MRLWGFVCGTGGEGGGIGGTQTTHSCCCCLGAHAWHVQEPERRGDLYEVATTIGLLDANAVPFAPLVHKRAAEVSRTPNAQEYLWYHSVLAEMGRPESLGSPSLKRDVAEMVAKMKRAAHSRTEAAHVASAREKKKRKHTLQALN